VQGTGKIQRRGGEISARGEAWSPIAPARTCISLAIGLHSDLGAPWTAPQEDRTVAWSTHDYDRIPGTYVFNGRRSAMGYPINRMCMSFNHAENREAFTRDEEAYCARFGLTPEQRDAVRRRDVLRLVQLGGNIYYLAKFAGIFNLSVQDVGAQQRGMSVEAFRTMLEQAGEPVHG
jgi:protocatechuate 4,5-dioxygenase alpha subunit